MRPSPRQRVHGQLQGLAYHNPSIHPAIRGPERKHACAPVRERGNSGEWRRAVVVVVMVVVVVGLPPSPPILQSVVSTQVLAAGYAETTPSSSIGLVAEPRETCVWVKCKSTTIADGMQQWPVDPTFRQTIR